MVDLPSFFPKVSRQAGQTLIETLVAIFILVMGVTAAVGLAIYAFNSSTSVTKQIIAVGLAREGVEAVKNMRDTNWLVSSINTNCYDYVNGQSDAKCYQNWLKPPGAPSPGNGFDISQPPNGKALRLNIDASGGSQYWVTQSDSAGWGLDFDPNLTCGSNFCGFYGVNNINSGETTGNSGFYRQILITQDNTTVPYNQSSYPLLKVEARVWWTDKKCPQSATWPGLGNCSVSIQTDLTNWKNY
ncbi:MAG TPA: prepilin-type N-terminal cleavage/methylation domain-containing protein [Patescibacteria group bacterium]|nr:prepilin-type N-terminal cleavage/methylation domain-containing protein [Patescibacteria group bacterium]